MPMNRSIITIVFSILTVTAICQAAERPNILLIFADDLGYEALNCYGGLDYETPSLDKLARDGMRLTRCYTSSQG